jgi:hypothetical protein
MIGGQVDLDPTSMSELQIEAWPKPPAVCN